MIPLLKLRASLWAKNCKREDLLEKEGNWEKTTYVCGKHFENKMFLNDIKNRLQPHAIPTLHLEVAIVNCKYSDKYIVKRLFDLIDVLNLYYLVVSNFVIENSMIKRKKCQ